MLANHHRQYSALRSLALPLLALLLLLGTARADNLKTAKDVIGKQLAFLKAGNTAKLKSGFTARLQERITADIVKKAQKDAKGMTIDDLVAEVSDGTDSIKIKMKNKRTLTTLVKVDGKWLADTIWFK